MNSRRGPAGVCFRHCLRFAAAPTALATAVALVAHVATRPTLVDGEPVAAAATPWLTLPLFTVALTCSLAAAWLWPTFALRRPGRDLVRRLVRGPFGGRGAVIAGAVAAQLAVSLPLLAVLPFVFDAPAYARRHVRPAGPVDAVLDSTRRTLHYQLPTPAVIEEIWLRPHAALPTGPDPTTVTLTSDGEPLAATPIAFAGTLELVRIPIARRQLARFELTRTGGDVPLLFRADGVTAVGPADVPSIWNSAIVAGLAAATTALILSLIALLGRITGLATLATTIVSLQFVPWIAGVGPLAAAQLALLRGIAFSPW